jgi:hypothetical protein
MRNTLGRLLLVSMIALTGTPAVAGSAVSMEEPDMVQPELLPQGFVLVVTDETRTATPDQPIYFASSINGWNPADPDFVLSPRSDTRWQIIIDKIPANTTIAFKLTMGGWDREELDGSGNSIDNRSLPKIDRSKLAPGEKPVIEVSVPQFRTPVALSEQVRESGPYRKLSVTGDVRRLAVQGGAGGAEALSRDLLVWLPEGYDAPENAGRRYPVLYMMDGQNIFEAMPGLPGEWGVDETAQSLIAAGKVEPLIIVGVPHAGEYRLTEYLPVGSVQGHSGDGANFVAWMRGEVMPRVERAFRVKGGAEHTGIGGASLGRGDRVVRVDQAPRGVRQGDRGVVAAPGGRRRRGAGLSGRRASVAGQGVRGDGWARGRQRSGRRVSQRQVPCLGPGDRLPHGQGRCGQ